MKKRIIIISAIVVCISIIAIWFFYRNSANKSEYDKAKKESLNFLNKNITKLEELSKKSLRNEDEKAHEFKGKKYYYSVRNGKECVVIEINAQGMLGGQYWDLIYCEDDYIDKNNVKIYNEYEETGKGNNIFVTEKIRDNWYFLYEDWDGKVDTTNIRNN